MSFKKIYKKVLIVLIILFFILSVAYFFIKRTAPINEGIWTNEDKSFILNTDNATAIITSPNGSEIFTFIFHPETNFHMYYPLPDDAVSVSDSDDVHKGQIYRIKFFEIDYIHVKCDDGCFNVYLEKKKSETS